MGQSVEKKRRVHAFYQVTMGSKNGKPVLTEDQAEALAQSSGLTVDQVKEQFEAFKTEHPNGKMKRKDFKEMMSKALPKKTRIKWRSMCSESTTRTMMDTSTLLSSWLFSTSCLTVHQQRSCRKSSECSMSTVMEQSQRRSYQD